MPKDFDRRKHLIKVGKNTRFKKKRATNSCEFCGKLYERIPSNIGRFCSHKCSNIARAKELGDKRKGSRHQIEITCSCCGKKFMVPQCRILQTRQVPQRYCSAKCRTNSSKRSKADKQRLYIWAKQVKLRDKFQCVECGEADRNLLHAHHIVAKKDNLVLWYEVENGETLCIYCHAEKHDNCVRSMILWKDA